MSQLAPNFGSAADQRARGMADGLDGLRPGVLGGAKHPYYSTLGGVTYMSTDASRSLNYTFRNGGCGFGDRSARLSDILGGGAERFGYRVHCCLSNVTSAFDGGDHPVLGRFNQ